MPFKEELPFFILFVVLAGSADCYYSIKEFGFVFGFYMFAHNLLLSYVLISLCSIFSIIKYRFVKILLLLLAFANLIVDAGVHSIMGYGYTGDMTAIVLGTNVQESTEFVKMYLTPGVVGFVLSVVVVSCGVSLLCGRFLSKKMVVNWIIGCLVVFLSLVPILRRSNNWEGVFYMKLYSMASYKTPANLSDYSREYSLTYSDNHPDNVIWVIGESLCKSNMSLYSYSLPTSPYLEVLKDSDRIVVYDNVHSSTIGTVSSFQCMMTSNTNDAEIPSDWYLKDNLIDIVNCTDYDTYWISNQSPSGAYDNVVAKFAALTDSTIWCGNKYQGIAKKDYDEDVLPVFESVLNNSSRRKFMIVHLMGSHENFSSRFPSEFSRFSSSDYAAYPEQQRQTRADYDNSVLYNDYIINSLIELCSNTESVLVYFPDHALDLFESDPDFAGHARSNSSVSIEAAKRIPFVVFCSDSFKASFPEKYCSIVDSVNRDYSTQDIMYTFLDLLGVNSVDGLSLNKMSLFN